jgi:hypothetical protein
MNPTLASIFNVVLVGTLASLLLRIGPVALVLAIVVAIPYVTANRLAS